MPAAPPDPSWQGSAPAAPSKAWKPALGEAPPAPHPAEVWAPGSGPRNLPFSKMPQCSPGKTRGGQNVEHIPACQWAACRPVSSPALMLDPQLSPGWGQADNLTPSVRCHPATSSQTWSHPSSVPRGTPSCWLCAPGKPSTGEDPHELPGGTPSPSYTISDGGCAVQVQHHQLPCLEAWLGFGHVGQSQGAETLLVMAG